MNTCRAGPFCSVHLDNCWMDLVEVLCVIGSYPKLVLFNFLQ